MLVHHQTNFSIILNVSHIYMFDAFEQTFYFKPFCFMLFLCVILINTTHNLYTKHIDKYFNCADEMQCVCK